MVIIGESVHYVQPGIYSAWTPRGVALVYITALNQPEPVCMLLPNGMWIRRVRPLQGQYVAHLIDLEAQRLMGQRPKTKWEDAAYDAGEREWLDGFVPLAEGLTPPTPALPQLQPDVKA